MSYNPVRGNWGKGPSGKKDYGTQPPTRGTLDQPLKQTLDIVSKHQELPMENGSAPERQPPIVAEVVTERNKVSLL